MFKKVISESAKKEKTEDSTDKEFLKEVEFLEKRTNPTDFSEDSSEGESKYRKFSVSSLPPFCSYIHINKNLIFYLMENVEKPIIFMTATARPHIVQNAFSSHLKNTALIQSNHTPDKLNEILIISSKTNYFLNNRISWKQLWEDFGNGFYNDLTNVGSDSPDLDPTYGLLFIPSYSKASLFYKNCLPGRTKYYSLIRGQLENIHVRKFQTEGPHDSKIAIRVASSQSSLSTGLSLPNHKFMLVGADIFKPYSYLRSYQHLEAKNAQYIETFQTLVQVIGRMSRLTPLEKTNPSVKSKRVLFISKSEAFYGMTEHLVRQLSTSYETIKIVDISDFEYMFSNMSRRSTYFDYFDLISKQNKINLMHHYFQKTIENSELFRLNILLDLISYLKYDAHEFQIKNHEQKVIKFMVLASLIKVCSLLQDFIVKFENDNTTKTITTSELFKPFHLSEKESFYTLYMEVIKAESRNLLEFFKKNKKLPFELDISNKNQKTITFEILEYFLSLEKIQILFNKILL